MRLTRGATETKTLAEKLRAARLAKGLSAQELADKVDLTAQQIRRYENALAEPTAIIFARIVRALEKPTPKAKHADTLTYKLLDHVLNDEELANKLWDEHNLAGKLPESKDVDFKAKKAILKAMSLWER